MTLVDFIFISWTWFFLRLVCLENTELVPYVEIKNCVQKQL